MSDQTPPVPMLLWCPSCGERHYDEGEFATKPHHTHACQHCGMVWRPALVPTAGVKFLPGFKNEELFKNEEPRAEVKPPTAAPAKCSYCGHPASSDICQRSHP